MFSITYYRVPLRKIHTVPWNILEYHFFKFMNKTRFWTHFLLFYRRSLYLLTYIMFNFVCVSLYLFLTDQFVSKRNTLATSSSQFGTFKAQYAVDENFTQNIIYCSHTSNERNIKEAWLRINLRKVYSIKSVKFWYRTDSMYCF